MSEGYSEKHVAQAAEAFARGDVEFDETAEVELPSAPEAEPMVMRGVRLPVELDRRVRAATEKAGVPFSTLVREWIELGLTEMDNDRAVSLSALRRAIAHATQSGQAV